MTFISHIHSDLRRSIITRRNAGADEDASPSIEIKSYPRMKHIALPEPEPSSATLADTLLQRVSSPGIEPVAHSLQTWGTLLGMSLRIRSNSFKRPYPSGGGLYPIETYLISESIANVRSSVFHYDPAAHALDILWSMPPNIFIRDLFRNEPETAPSTLVVFTSVWDRSAGKYGDFSYILSLLEAGHMSQNMQLVATSLRLAMCPLGAFNDETVTRLLDIDTQHEQAVHVLAL